MTLCLYTLRGLVKVTLENGEQIEATSGHPFYIQGKGWNAAANLKVGDALLLYNGTTVVVATVDSRVGRERVYNFSVAQNANYFVGSGGVGVHNCPAKKERVKKDKPKSNTDQNKQVEDAARTVGGLDDKQRKRLKDEVEKLSKFGEILDYHDIVDIATDIKNGKW